MGLIVFVVKFGLFAISVVFLLLGVLMLVVGVLMLSHLPNLEDLIGKINIAKQCIFMIALGIVTIGLGLFGVIGAITRNFCALVVFLIAIVLLILVQFYTGFSLVSDTDNMAQLLEETLYQKFEKIVKESDAAEAEEWHLYEISDECCGIKSSDDYQIVLNGTIPPTSCCRGMTEELWKEKESKLAPRVAIANETAPKPCDNKPYNLNRDGCLNSILDMISAAYGWLQAMSFIHIGVNIAAACCAAFLIFNKFNPIPLP